MCFGLGWVENLLIWLIVVCAIVALLRLLISFVLPRLGMEAEIMAVVIRAITIVIWAMVCIALVYFVFELIACLLPLAPMRR
jgi:hypothetical protein